MPDNLKAIPKTITIFGAGGRIGGPVARFIRAQRPDIRLRLVTSSPHKTDALKKEFPESEVVVADYLDEASMERALENSEGVFLVTPNFLDEERAMEIFIRAAQRLTSLKHIVRILGDPPGMTFERVPKELRDYKGGTAIQHLRAKRVLDAANLPITYINIAAYLMDNLFSISRPLREERKLIVPYDRLMAFIDPRDVGETSARLLLSDNHRHIGQYYHIDNGQDVMRFSAVAQIMSEVIGEPIAYDSSGESYLREFGARVRERMKDERAAEYFLSYFKFEYDNETVWRCTDFCESILERKPTTLKAWLTEHRSAVF